MKESVKRYLVEVFNRSELLYATIVKRRYSPIGFMEELDVEEFEKSLRTLWPHLEEIKKYESENVFDLLDMYQSNLKQLNQLLKYTRFPYSFLYYYFGIKFLLNDEIEENLLNIKNNLGNIIYQVKINE